MCAPTSAADVVVADLGADAPLRARATAPTARPSAASRSAAPTCGRRPGGGTRVYRPATSPTVAQRVGVDPVHGGDARSRWRSSSVVDLERDARRLLLLVVLKVAAADRTAARPAARGARPPSRRRLARRACRRPPRGARPVGIASATAMAADVGSRLPRSRLAVRPARASLADALHIVARRTAQAWAWSRRGSSGPSPRPSDAHVSTAWRAASGSP